MTQAASNDVAAGWAAVSAAAKAPALVNPLCADEVVCGKCGDTQYVDIPIHEGRSTRRDCVCGRTLSFPRWNEPTTASVDGIYKLPPQTKSPRKRKAK